METEMWNGVNNSEHIPPANPTGSRIRLCDFWSRNGNCLHGDNCRFYHDPTITPRPLMDARASRVADSNVGKGRDSLASPRDRGQRASTSRSPLSATHSIPINNTNSPGHTSASPPHGGGSRRVCDFYLKYGNCRSGRACKFLHNTTSGVYGQQQQVQAQQPHQGSPGSEHVSMIKGTQPFLYSGSHSSSESHSPLGAVMAAHSSDGHFNVGAGFMEPPQWNDMDVGSQDGKGSMKDGAEGMDWDDNWLRGWGAMANRDVALWNGVADAVDKGLSAGGSGLAGMVVGGERFGNVRGGQHAAIPNLNQLRVHSGFAGKVNIGNGGNVGGGVGGGHGHVGAMAGMVCTPPPVQNVISSNVPTGKAKWALGQDGTAWFVTGDGWAHNAAGGRRRVCDFFDTKGNCRHGSACGFLHITRDAVLTVDEHVLAHANMHLINNASMSRREDVTQNITPTNMEALPRGLYGRSLDSMRPEALTPLTRMTRRVTIHDDGDATSPMYWKDVDDAGGGREKPMMWGQVDDGREGDLNDRLWGGGAFNGSVGRLADYLRSTLVEDAGDLDSSL